jgi:hypothetical protein
MTKTQENINDNQAEDTESQNVNISIEQILAAVLQTVGAVTVALPDLVTNYNTKQIAVNQNEDQSVTFSLVDAPVVEEEVEQAE